MIRKMLWIQFLPILAIALALLGGLISAAANTTTTATTTNSTTTQPLAQLVGSLFTNPQTAAVILIEFLLGFGLGYTAVKALKYILAFIGILFLGSALSVWSLGSNTKEIAKSLGLEVKQLLPVLKSLIAMLGAVVVGPASVGVIVGIIVAITRK